MRFSFISLTLLLGFGPFTSQAADRALNTEPAVRSTKLFEATNAPDPTKSPPISAHALFLGTVGIPGNSLDTGKPIPLGARVQDLSVQMSANIDDIFAGMVTLGNIANFGSSQDFSLGTSSLVREAYVKTITLPVISFKVGEFLTNFGKNNKIYPHAQPMIDQPLIVNELMGTNGFRSAGIEMDLLIPTPWFFDLNVAVVSASLAGPFSSTKDNTVVGVFRMEHDFDFSQNTSLGFGLSGAYGNNSFKTGKNTFYTGADLTVKYSVPQGFGFAWLNEFIYTDAGRASESSHVFGFYTNPMFRFHPKFWTGLRFDYTSRAAGITSTTGESVMLAWVAGPASTVRLQGGFLQPAASTNNWSLSLQYNMTLGSHPAHAL